MVRKTPGAGSGGYEPREYVALRTGVKKISGRDGELILVIFQNIGMQIFTYTDVKQMLEERAPDVRIGQTKLGSFAGWGWVNIVGETIERRPRFKYQISIEMQRRLEAILSGERLDRYSRMTF